MRHRNATSMLIAVTAAAFTAACQETGGGAPVGRGPQGPPAAGVIAHTVGMRADTTRVEAVGTARAKRQAIIQAESGGEVVEIGFSAGDKVEEGDLLLALESEAERLAVSRARVAVKDAEQLLARYQRIDVPGAISDSQIDEARTALEAAQIDLDLALRALEERTVRAPFAGHVGITDIDPGARITTQTEITRLDDRSVLYVDFAAPEQVFASIAPGDVVGMAPFSQPGTLYNAEILAIDSRIDPGSRAFQVRAAIDNIDDALRPGMSFRIGFELPGADYPAVPEAAIVWGGDGAYIWAVREGRAERVPVTIVAREEGFVLVRATLRAGEQVVAEGVQKVRDGAPVTIQERDAAPVSLRLRDPAEAAPLTRMGPP